jgi:hypothetical protein
MSIETGGSAMVREDPTLDQGILQPVRDIQDGAWSLYAGG